MTVTPSGCDQPREVERRRFAFGVRIGRDDDFVRPLRADALDEFLDAQLRRTDAVHRRDQSAEHVIAAVDTRRSVRSRRCLWLRRRRRAMDASRRSSVQIVARIVFGDRKAARAQAHAIFERDDRFGQRLRIVRGRLSKWNTSRAAVFGPIVGSLENSLIRAATGPAMNPEWARGLQESGNMHPAGHRSHRFC